MIERKALHPHQISECVGEFLKEGDLEGIVSMFHPNCIICFPPDEPLKKGHEGVRETFADFMEMRPNLVSNVTGVLINGDTALMQANWHIEDTEGNKLAEGSSNEVAKKLENGGWGYFIDCPISMPKFNA